MSILPSGAAPDPRLLELLSRSKADRSEKRCVQQPAACALWIVDLEADGVTEAVLLRESGRSVQATAYANGQAGCRREAEVQGPSAPLTEWFTAIANRAAATVKPRWLDLQLGPRKYWVRPY